MITIFSILVGFILKDGNVFPLASIRQRVRSFASTPVCWKLRRQLADTLKTTQTCQIAQQHALTRILQLNADSRFSRDFGINRPLTPVQFSQQFPVSEYETFAPYLQQVVDGDTKALLGPQNPLLMLAMTSGTTSDAKSIPITKPFLEDYRRGWQTWAIRAFDDHSHLHGMTVLQLCSDYDIFRTENGIPCGNISGLVQSMHNLIVQQRFTVSPATIKIRNARLKMYYSLLQGIIDTDVGLISTANPSTLIQLANMLSSESETIIQDLFDGTILGDPFPAGPGCRPIRHRRRARELERLHHHNELNPLTVWPNLTLLAVWIGGSVKAYLPELRQCYPGIPIRDHGLSASEGRMTIPIEDETSSGILDVQTHFFEFIPESEAEEKSPRTLLAHELERDGVYEIVLTTVSGLSRYRIHDFVRCTGFLGTTPLLEFLHKGAHISNVTGEKITESQIVTAVRTVSEQHGITLSQFLVTPRWDTPPRYVAFVAEQRHGPQLPPHFAIEIDQQLRKLNCEYDGKRDSNRLSAMEVHPVPPTAFEQLAQQRQSKPGASAEQYKHPFLVPDLEFYEQFLERYQFRKAQ